MGLRHGRNPHRGGQSRRVFDSFGNRPPLSKMTQATLPTPRAVASGTAEAARQAMQDVARGYPPVPHGLGDSPAVASIWRAVMVARLPSQWHAIDIEHAANLVRSLHQIVDHDAAMQREGMMLGHGLKMYANPRHQVIDMLNRRAAMLTRLLQLHAVPTARANDRAGPKAEAGAAADTLAGMQHPPTKRFSVDDLFQRPSLQ